MNACAPFERERMEELNRQWLKIYIRNTYTLKAHDELWVMMKLNARNWFICDRIIKNLNK